ncbi:type I modular polyketide synthase, MlsA1 [Actinomadura verrucosospora]|uniref:Type I modular polyketide synthase, MlsA1 n=2 Tax=Actinomadura verrucosospora TaxID=46165 RepID=A0A7D4AHB2_ACTVE|nr:type I modular polyketide synthase, MlsA1 [Actinomadura verrucosospora]
MPADKVLEALRASLKETERLRRQNRRLVSASRVPVAIVGMGCRYPGGVRDPEGYWDLLASGTDAMGDFPRDRGWEVDGGGSGDDGTSYARQGGFLYDAAEFDAGFFGISPREALAMDPQQRVLLEVAWEALERAGIDPETLRGSTAAVYAGAAFSGYTADAAGSEGYLLTGGLAAVISGRVSYTLGLEGPAVTVDTACSSSLVALHLAVQALRAGECSLALVGGVTIMPTPGVFAEFSRQQGLAADGRCKSFAAAADGTGWAEGAGVLVLERLPDARRAGRRALAVVAGSAVNQDGASNGLTAPNGPSQQRVIRAALDNARLSASEVDAVEAHGTGTVLGDPIEAQALLSTYGQDRPDGRPLWLGSVKSNIGHTSAAAGVAGVIKMVLALQHRELPRTLHVDEPTPQVDWSAGDVRLLTEPVPWTDGDRPRRAGVSSFGVSGTNVHAILEEPPAPDDGPADDETENDDGEALPVLASEVLAWPVSGRGAEGLAGQAERLREFVEARPGLDPAGVAWSLVTTRSVFEHRAVVVGTGRDELTAGLSALATGDPAAGVVQGTAARTAGRTVFVFPGQGSQWVGMGRELALSSPVFAARLAECGAALAPFVDWSLQDVLDGIDGAPGLEAADVVQPVLWAVMVSLAAVWQAAGVRPDAVVGHSQGEIAAACVAGILSLEDAARVVALRSKALTVLAGRGGMLSVAESAAKVRERLAAWGERLSVAAVNGPAATVVSGEPDALDELAVVCAQDDVRTRLLPVDYASHSAQVEGLRSEIVAALEDVVPSPAQVPMVSAMTGEFLDGSELEPSYWYASLRATVEFDRAVRVLGEAGHRVFVEVSPHPVLTSAITDTLDDQATAIGTLRRDDGGPDRFLTSLAEAHVSGTNIDWTAVLPSSDKVELPTYAFQHEHYWTKPSLAAGDVRSAGLGSMGHPLLGAAVELAAGDGLVFTGRLSLRAQPWLADHAVAGTVLLPGTAFVELAVRAGYQAGCTRIEELALAAPLLLPSEGALQVQVSVSGPGEDGRRAVEIHSRDEDAAVEAPWTRHASGLLAPPEAGGGLPDAADFAMWPPQGAVPADSAGMYASLAANGYEYGPLFRGLRAAWRRGDEVFAEVALPEDADAGAFGLHPALLDSAMHAIALAGRPAQPDGILLPFTWNGVAVHAAGASVLRVRLRWAADGSLSLDAADGAGAPVVSVGSLVFRPVTAAQLEAAGGALRDALFSVEWTPVQVPSGRPEGRWAVVGDDPLGVAAGLAAAGAEVRAYPELAALPDEVSELVVVNVGGPATPGGAADAAEAARLETGRVLELLQRWLADDRLGTSRLVLVTRGAVATGPGEGVADLAGAAVRGLAYSAQSENPDRIVLVDLPADDTAESWAALAAVTATDEPELAIRPDGLHARRLARPSGGLVPPDGGVPWRLAAEERGTLDGLALVPCPEAAAPLEPGQVRVAVRAAGLNLRDVVVALDMLSPDLDPVGGVLGSEIAGVVLEAGPGVTALAPGDRVLGLATGGFGPVVVTDARQLARVPAGWSFTAAASVPVAFTTAWYALVDLARARPGRRLLVHSAAGGVGMAAVSIGRYLGLEVFGTASPGKHTVLAGLGLDADHVASSRSAEFEEAFLASTGGAGMDIVLNALAGELTDASLRLLPRGGMFLELGKTDLRDPDEIAREYPGVRYRAFNPGESGPAHVGEILAQVVGLLDAGELAMPPVRAWDVRRAPEALRHMSRARHVGKIVLTVPADPAAPSEPGTVLVTGGTGVLGGLVARHLAETGRARRTVLTSRSGPAGRGIPELVAAVAAGGAEVRVAACDAADPHALAALLDGATADVPLTGVVHAAGVLDDGVIGSLTPARVATVMRPKADAAWNLHRLTRNADLDLFVLFSSASATFGSTGQGNYAAANAFLDALAARRRAEGLPAASLAWGLWADSSAMTGHLTAAERERISRGGMAALTTEEGLGLLDLAASRDEAVLVPARLDVAGLRAQVAGGAVLPALWRGLAGAPLRRSVAATAGEGMADSLRRQLAALPGPDGDRMLLDLVRGHVAAVLGHSSPAAIEPRRAFKEIGFDSLTAVELRNRLGTATGLRLPATLAFDYPTPLVLAAHLRTGLMGEGAGTAAAAPAAVPAAAADEPIAIVGMSCRFPGARNPEGLWDMLIGGRDAISEAPPDRGWDAEGLYDPDPDHEGTAYVLAGGFVRDAAEFDPGFFGISPREALAMDPQQRLLLEVSWEALERAGLRPDALRGSATGVFAGAGFSGYAANLNGSGTEGTEGYLLTGTATSVISGRVAYTLGLEGPAVTVDTACSSSLVALHLACQSLRAGECTLALAGGVTVMVDPMEFVGFSRQRALAGDGRCKAFSADADGMGMGEGAGVLVVERLSDARRNGHRVLAVVRGSAMNQDGASNGLTAPNGPSQQRVIRAALAGAGVRADEVDAVEAHGTGTTLGDPIEAQALLATYGQDRPEDRPLLLGSVKSNIGHAQCAAGVAGVMKMVLALQHRTLPPTLHAETPSPHVDWSSGAVRLLTGPVDWTTDGRPRRAGVSSFGISGTNAHAILEEAPASTPPPVVPDGGDDRPARVLSTGTPAWPVSGRTGAGLAAQAGRLREFVLAHPDLDPADVGWSLATTRSMFEHRAVVIGADRSELAAALAAVATGLPAPGVVTGEVPAGGSDRAVFVFPGQGSQWIGMGRELAAASPVFAARLAECAAALAPLVDWSLQDVLAGADGAPGLETADVVQPALWAVMVSLAAVWEAAGVHPDAVVGHSQGEIAAACVAGILSVEDAAKVVALRSKALTALAGRGGMLSIAEPADKARERLAAWGERLSVAAVNGPAATVVSGEPDALHELAAACEAESVRNRLLPVDYASHSAQVEAIEQEILDLLKGIVPGQARIPMVSAMTGAFLDGPELDASYWYASLRAPVEFDRAIRVLAEAGHQVFIETSPHPVLASPITDTLEDRAATATVVGTLRRDDGGPDRLLTSLAEAHVRGTAVDWTAVLPAGEPVDLPTYAFEHRRFWPGRAGAAAGDVAAAGLGALGHPLLGAAVELAGGEGSVFTGRLSLREQPWLADHAIGGRVLLPATAFVELAVRAGYQAGCVRVEELALAAPLILPPSGAVQIQVTVGAPDEHGRHKVGIYSRAGDAAGAEPWTRHAAGVLAQDVPAADPDEAAEFAVWPPEGAVPVPVDGLYETMAAGGYGYGPTFQGLRAAWRRGDDVFAEVALPEDADASAFGLHPALLDAALQATALAGGAAAESGVRMPFAWNAVSLHAAGASALRVRLRQDSDGVLSLVAADPAGAPVVSVGSLVLRPVALEQAEPAGGGARDALFAEEWVGLTVPSVRPGARWAVVGADPLGLAAGLAAAGVDIDAHADLDGLVEDGAPVPDVVLAGISGAASDTMPEAGDVPGDARALAGQVLELLQGWLAEPRLESSRLVLVSRAAVAARPGDGVADVAAAAARGLVRSGQAENPDRLVLADLPADTTAEDWAAFAAAPVADEPELAIRDGAAHGRRLARPAIGPAPENEPAADRPAGTVLITGGTGTLGGLVARHLVATKRAGHVVLASRSGAGAPGAAGLAADLAAGGAGVQVTMCDAAERDALGALLDRVPADRPLSTVVHTAGVLDDGVIESLSPARLATVMRPKADAAWNLHELTRDLDLEAFVLFSSSASILGGAGQGGYVAANAFLDALAGHRRAAGLPAMSLAWGPWVSREGIGRNLTEGLAARITRSGIADLSAEEGLVLLDLALARDEAVLVPVRLDVAGLRTRVAGGAVLPALWRTLAGPTMRRAGTAAADGGTGAAEALRRRLAALPEDDRDRTLLDLVRGHVAAVLGHAAPEAIEPGRAFSEIGFDSLTAVELRNRLAAATGLRLPATLVFDHPTPLVLAARLRDGLLGDRGEAAAPVRPAAASGDPIAIVGMSCRFPGGVRDPEGLWEVLATGADVISQVPADRGWDAEGLYDPDPDHEGTAYVLAGGFVREAAEFDPAFFGISPREALAMDPQQRLLLEVSWEALERVGIAPDSLRGSPTGVFAGASSWGYGGDPGPGAEGYLLTGTAPSVVSGRVSYTLGLEGPAVTVDTACSSSLVALHLACQALRAGECTLALAGGVTIMASPGGLVGFSRQRALAADGRCKAFSASADGMGMAEGAAMLVVERLSDARRNGHRVLAVVAGSAVNQDGASNGLTAPNGPSQQRVIRAALAGAGLSAPEVDAVEAHGTGTELGDPIEAQALLATYGQDRPEDRPLLLGSVKSNIGHAQCAAGAAGVMKVVLALQHDELPRTLHADEPSPHVDWSAGHVRLLTEPAPWHANGHPRRAGISSFGISGTNAHVIVEEAPDVPDVADGDAGKRPAQAAVPWAVSGRGGDGLRAQAERLRAYLAERPDLDPVDVGHALATTRSVLNHRAVIVGTTRDDLLAGLATIAEGQDAANVVSGTTARESRVLFAFPEPDTTWPGLAARLLEESPVFADRMADCEKALAAHLDWSPLAVVRGAPDAPPLDQPGVARPVLFAVLVSLAALWRSAGVRPAAVAGDGVGEIAAAQVAGVLTLADAAAIACGRTEAHGVSPRAGTVPVYSASQSAWMDGDQMDTAHWTRDPSPSEPFRDTVQTLIGEGYGVCVEVSPDPMLTGEFSGGEGRRAPVTVTGTLRRDDDGLSRFLLGLAAVHVHGVPVDWAALYTGPPRRRVDLPTYAFQRQRYWPEASAASVASPGEQRFWDAVEGFDLDALAGMVGADEPLRADMPLGTVLAMLSSWRQRNRRQDAAEPEPAGDGTEEVRPGPEAAEWARTMAELAGPEQEQRMLDLVRGEIAAVLGYGSADAVDADGDVMEMGITSISAVQLRATFIGQTGLELPEGFVYELYSPAAIADYLLSEFLAQD